MSSSDVHSAEGNDMAIALRRKVDFVGKTNKKSKVCVFWAFQSRRGSKFRHEVKMTYSSLSGKRRVWLNGKLIHDSRQFKQKSEVPHRFRFEGGGYRLECLSLKHKDNYKINLIVDDIPFIKLPRRSTQISLKDIFKPRRMCRSDGTWGLTTAITLGCTSEHLGKRLSGSKRKISYYFAFLDSPDREHCVEVMYSILSGKRQIKVDNTLVHKSQKLQMTLSFKHAFRALGHTFEMMVEEKSDVIMTRLCIDGMDFRRLPLLLREQLRMALQTKKSSEHADHDEVEDEEDDNDDYDDEGAEIGDASDGEADDGERDAFKAKNDDLLADLFAADDDSAADQGASSTPASFDPFASAPKPPPTATTTSSNHVVDNLGALFAASHLDNTHTRRSSNNFVDSPTSSTVPRVMDPFAKLAAQARNRAAEGEETFDPFGETANTRSKKSAPVTEDPFAGF